MPEEWERTNLGDVLHLDIDRVEVSDAAIYPMAGVYSFGRGLLRREPMRGSETAYRFLHRLRGGQLIMSKLKAWEGALAVVDDEFEGSFSSSEFPTFTCDGALLPSFVSLLIQRRSFWERLKLLSTGVGGRKERVKPAALLSVEVTLPSVEEQRRIVDLIESVDTYIASFDDAANRAADVLLALRDAFDSEQEQRRTIDELIESIDAGRSPSTDGRPPEAGERAVLKVGAVQPGRFDPAEAKALGGDTAMPENALLRDGDILMTRANTAELVGATCRVGQAPERHYLSDKTLRLIPSDAVDPDYLVEALLTSTARQQLAGAATGTSASMKNLSQRSIRRVVVGHPSLDVQREHVATASSLHGFQRAASASAEAARTLRAALLSELVSGEHEIPPSYDRLLETVG